MKPIIGLTALLAGLASAGPLHQRKVGFRLGDGPPTQFFDPIGKRLDAGPPTEPQD